MKNMLKKVVVATDQRIDKLIICVEKKDTQRPVINPDTPTLKKIDF